MHFPVSGVDAPVWLPFVVALVVSFFTSMGGVSGAFLLLPFQMSYLNFVSPAVSATNLVFNIVAIPSGVYRFMREGRMPWPLAWVIVVGTLPGILIGAIIRGSYLPDPKSFKFFAGLVLLYIGLRMVYDLTGRAQKNKAQAKAQEERFARKLKEARAAGAEKPVKTISFNLREMVYGFYGEPFRVNLPALVGLVFLVGIIGGVYGIGGGAIVSPFLVAFFGLPVYTVAGAALFGTFVSSVAGVVFYTLIAPFYQSAGLAMSPDWLLGGLFGLGGMVGVYLGARTQRFVPAKVIKIILAGTLIFVAGKYILNFIW